MRQQAGADEREGRRNSLHRLSLPLKDDPGTCACYYAWFLLQNHIVAVQEICGAYATMPRFGICFVKHNLFR